MIEAFTENDFGIVRAGKNYITVRAPENDDRWRLKGDIFHENWTRENTLERSKRRESVETSRSGSRLDAIEIDVLRARLDGIAKRHRSYNGEQYPGSHSEEREIEMLRVFELEYRSVSIAFGDLITSWFWASKMIDKAQHASLWQAGLTIHQTKTGLVLTWDTERLQLHDCRTGSISSKCLQILERKLKMVQSEIRNDVSLTSLERDLLIYVEKLTEASEQSAE